MWRWYRFDLLAPLSASADTRTWWTRTQPGHTGRIGRGETTSAGRVASEFQRFLRVITVASSVIWQGSMFETCFCGRFLQRFVVVFHCSMQREPQCEWIFNNDEGRCYTWWKWIRYSFVIVEDFSCESSLVMTNDFSIWVIQEMSFSKGRVLIWHKNAVRWNADREIWNSSICTVYYIRLQSSYDDIWNLKILKIKYPRCSIVQ